MIRPLLLILLLIVLLLPTCRPLPPAPAIVVDVSEQSMRYGSTSYPVGTSAHGTGQRPGSRKTPLGTMRVVKKWEAGSRDYHGSIRGQKLHLAGADCPASRRIYIHAGRVGRPSSIGCIHLRPADLAELFRSTPEGTIVRIIP